jgi:hypothetical protein
MTVAVERMRLVQEHRIAPTLEDLIKRYQEVVVREGFQPRTSERVISALEVGGVIAGLREYMTLCLEATRRNQLSPLDTPRVAFKGIISTLETVRKDRIVPVYLQQDISFSELTKYNSFGASPLAGSAGFSGWFPGDWPGPGPGTAQPDRNQFHQALHNTEVGW